MTTENEWVISMTAKVAVPHATLEADILSARDKPIPGLPSTSCPIDPEHDTSDKALSDAILREPVVSKTLDK